METIIVTIPGSTASSSKMQKKGLKCWAKKLHGVKNPANTGYDYEGDFLGIGSAEMTLGDLILHVDDASGATLYVLVRGSKGNGYLVSMAESRQTRWAPELASDARRLLAVSPEERVRQAARAVLAAGLKDEAVRRNWFRGQPKRPYYEAMAGVTAAVPADPAVQLRPQAVAQIRDLMQQYGITVDDLR